MRRSVLVALLLAGTLTACSSSPPSYYYVLSAIGSGRVEENRAPGPDRDSRRG